MKTEFHRITRLPAYVFAEVNKLKAKYRDQGKDILKSIKDQKSLSDETEKKLNQFLESTTNEFLQ